MQVKLREQRLDTKKPILEKEIEKAAWFHNLILDLGHHTFTKIVRYVPWDLECAQDEQKALNLLTSYVDTLVKLHKQVEEYRATELKLILAEQYLEKMGEAIDRLMERVKKQDMIIQSLLPNLCPGCVQRALARLIVTFSLTQFGQQQAQKRREQKLVSV